MQFRAFVHPGKILLENGLVGACPTAVHSTFVCREGIDVKFRKNQDIKKQLQFWTKVRESKQARCQFCPHKKMKRGVFTDFSHDWPMQLGEDPAWECQRPWRPWRAESLRWRRRLGQSSMPWKSILFPLATPPQGESLYVFKSSGAQHWKPVSAFFQRLEAGFAKVSRHWRHVLGFLQTLEEGLGKCSKGWRPVSAKVRRVEDFSPGLGGGL